MANYYTHLSLAIEDWPEEAMRFAQRLDSAVYCVEPGEEGTLEFIPDGEDYGREIEELAFTIYKDNESRSGCTFAVKEGKLYVYSDEGGEPQVVADILQHTMCRFKLPKAVIIEYADTCSKPLPNAYGGGVIVVTAEEQHHMHTHEWSVRKAAELAEKHELLRNDAETLRWISAATPGLPWRGPAPAPAVVTSRSRSLTGESPDV